MKPRQPRAARLACIAASAKAVICGKGCGKA
jgi:hypothetical protein